MGFFSKYIELSEANHVVKAKLQKGADLDLRLLFK